MSWLELYAAFGAPALLVSITIVLVALQRRRWRRSGITGRAHDIT